MKIVLFQPQIPQNTGNIVRTCAVTGSNLVLVKPLGFNTNDRWLKRAGLDYWDGVDVTEIDDLMHYLQQLDTPFYFFTSKAKRCFTTVPYTVDTALVFGSETSGLPSDIVKRWPDQCVTIPMKPEGGRCLNLATSVGIGVYEASRQLNFKNFL